jgi:hypothetical protein
LFDFTMSQRPSLRAQYPNLVFVDREDNPKCSSPAPERQLTNLKGDLVVFCGERASTWEAFERSNRGLEPLPPSGGVLGALRTAQA